MTAVVEGVLKVTFSLLCNRLRDITSKKLHESADLTDLMFRQILLKELDDIKGKLDGLARKDLLSSVSFIKEGVALLKISFDAKDSEVTGKYMQQKNEAKRNPIPTGEAVMSEGFPLAFARAIGKLKIASAERFASASSCFKSAREKATEAFNNEALSIEDRIFATKLRMTSRILESLEDPDAAATACLPYLEELHALPAVRGIFSVQFERGMKSRLQKTKRLENVKSVIDISLILFEFTKKFTKIPLAMFNWPRIQFDDQSYHPVLGRRRVSFSQLRQEPPPFFQIILTKGVEINPYISAVNSKGDIITETTRGIAAVTNNEIHAFGSFPKSEAIAKDFSVTSLAVDEEDNVYTIARSQQTGVTFNHKLLVFDAKGNLKKQCPLPFLSGEDGPISIAVNKDKKIIIKKSHGKDVYIFDTRGNLQSSFRLSMPKSRSYFFLSFNDMNEIIAGRDGGSEVHVYTEKGDLRRSIELPGRYEVKGVAFNHRSKTIIVLALAKAMFSLHLLSYHAEDEPQTLPLTLLDDDMIYTTSITSHPNGPVAVVHESQVIFI